MCSLNRLPELVHRRGRDPKRGGELADHALAGRHAAGLDEIDGARGDPCLLGELADAEEPCGADRAERRQRSSCWRGVLAPRKRPVLRLA